MSNPIPGQANVRTAVLRDHSNDPITTGTVSYYLKAKTGITDIKDHWWVNGGTPGTGTWADTETACGEMTVDSTTGIWSINVYAAAWVDTYQYVEYAIDSEGRNVPDYEDVLCSAGAMDATSFAAAYAAIPVTAPTGDPATWNKQDWDNWMVLRVRSATRTPGTLDSPGTLVVKSGGTALTTQEVVDNGYGTEELGEPTAA